MSLIDRPGFNEFILFVISSLFSTFFSLFFSPPQDCHIKTHSSSGEPVVDASQDYLLLSSSENATHTILRFRRKLDTCDEKFDFPTTVSKARVNNFFFPLWAYLIKSYTRKVLQKNIYRPRRTNGGGTFENKGNETALVMRAFRLRAFD